MCTNIFILLNTLSHELVRDGLQQLGLVFLGADEVSLTWRSGLRRREWQEIRIKNYNLLEFHIHPTVKTFYYRINNLDWKSPVALNQQIPGASGPPRCPSPWLPAFCARSLWRAAGNCPCSLSALRARCARWSFWPESCLWKPKREKTD